jgi:uncharacterized protein with beta-barrel porin domain
MVLMNARFITLVAASGLAWAVLASEARAQCTVDGDATPASCDGDGAPNTIFIDGTVNETVSTDAGLDNVEIVSPGEIAPPAGDDGIFDSDGGVTVFGNGSILTTGGGHGIHAIGSGDVTVDGVDISAAGSGGEGILEEGDGSVIVRNATVASMDEEAIEEWGPGSVHITNSTVFSNGNWGVQEEDAGDVYITNSTVYSTDNWGITEEEEGDVVVRNSTVFSTENYALRERNAGDVIVTNSTVYSLDNYAITSSGTGEVVIRNSTIYSTGNDAIDLSSDVGDLSIVGSRVYTTDAGSEALFYGGSGNTLTFANSHLAGDFAIDNSGDNNLFRIRSGTILEGAIDIGGAGNIFDFGPGYNGALTFVTPPDGFQSDNPFVVSGNAVAVIDITGFAVADVMIGDMTRTIAGTLEQRMASHRAASDGHANSFGADLAPEIADPAAPIATVTSTGWWGSGFGGMRDAHENDQVSSFDHEFLGGMAGYDWSLASGVAGLFGGYAAGEAESEYDTYQSDMSSWFGGGYFSQRSGATFYDYTLFTGVTGFDSARLVNNNQASGGVEFAEADYHGWWISPSLKAGHDFAAAGGVLTPSARLRYTGLFLDDYDESGSLAAMSVDGRAAHIVEVRGELAYRFAPIAAGSGDWNASWRAGVDGIFNWGDEVEATLLGTAIAFNTGQDESVARGYIGADATFYAHGGIRLTAGAEAGYDTTGAFDLSGQATIAVAF